MVFYFSAPHLSYEKQSFLLAFDTNPVPKEYLERLARKHGDTSSAQSFSLFRLTDGVPVG